MVILSTLFASLPLLGESFYVNYSQSVPVEDVLAHRRSILHPTVDLPVSDLVEQGHESFGYLSIGEIAPDASYRSEAISQGVPLMLKNQVWNSDVVDLSSERWHEFVLTQLAPEIVDRGFAGFFLDTMDAVDMLREAQPGRSEEFRAGLTRLVTGLKTAFPEHQVVVNRGFSVMDTIQDVIDGVLVESVFGSFDVETGDYQRVAEETTATLLRMVSPLKSAGKEIFILDYGDPADPEDGMRLAQKAIDHGFHSFVSTPALNGQLIAPLSKVPRKVLVLYGSNPAAGPWAPRYPFDSSTFLTMHMCFEWLGIEVEYHNAYQEAFHFDATKGYRAILTDQTLVIPTQFEEAFVDSVIQSKKAGVKILMAGHVPISGWLQTQRLFQALGIGGTGDLVAVIASQKFRIKDPGMMDFKEKVRLVPFNNLDLQAPSDADVYLSVECQTTDEKTLTFDAVFSAPWGGIMFEPYLFFTRPNFDDLWLLNPFKFLGESLDLDNFPVPDTTTRDGLRLFYSHIDGDGFANISEVDPNRRSSEIIRDEILTQYDMPITYSVIEAEVEALSMLQKSDTAPELRAIARSIFALPNVQVASHAYSHPFYWISDDPRKEIYNTQHLPLKNNYRFSLDREIGGSIDYINNDLAPEGKEVELFLWSGNCRPSVEALKKVRERRMLNMNGGDTLISTAKPSLSFVSPRTLLWEGELQILAANQNENVYTHDWTGPYFGMFSKVIDTFEKTELPLRLKPVNVYFHNYCGDKPDGLQSLKTIFDWVQDQDLHAVTALQYAKLARDSRYTSVFRRGPKDFVMVNEGELRTFRLRDEGLIPDLGRSKGVVGFNRHEGFLYLITDGRRRVSLHLAPANSVVPVPFLAASTGEVRWEVFNPDRLQFRVHDFRPIRLELGGISDLPHTVLKVNGQVRTLERQGRDRVVLQVPGEALIELNHSNEGAVR